jgi:hypothetical protein
MSHRRIPSNNHQSYFKHLFPINDVASDFSNFTKGMHLQVLSVSYFKQFDNLTLRCKFALTIQNSEYFLAMSSTFCLLCQFVNKINTRLSTIIHMTPNCLNFLRSPDVLTFHNHDPALASFNRELDKLFKSFIELFHQRQF